MKKLLAVLLTLALMLGMCSALAEDEPIKLTLWTFQELHTQLYKEMLRPGTRTPIIRSWTLTCRSIPTMTCTAS